MAFSAEPIASNVMRASPVTTSFVTFVAVTSILPPISTSVVASCPAILAAPAASVAPAFRIPTVALVRALATSGIALAMDDTIVPTALADSLITVEVTLTAAVSVPTNASFRTPTIGPTALAKLVMVLVAIERPLPSNLTGTMTTFLTASKRRLPIPLT